MAHTKQLADVQRGRADATSPPRAGGDALRKLLAAVEEDERLAYKLPVHLDGAERGLPPVRAGHAGCVCGGVCGGVVLASSEHRE